MKNIRKRPGNNSKSHKPQTQLKSTQIHLKRTSNAAQPHLKRNSNAPQTLLKRNSNAPQTHSDAFQTYEN